MCKDREYHEKHAAPSIDLEEIGRSWADTDANNSSKSENLLILWGIIKFASLLGGSIVLGSILLEAIRSTP